MCKSLSTDMMACGGARPWESMEASMARAAEPEPRRKRMDDGEVRHGVQTRLGHSGE